MRELNPSFGIPKNLAYLRVFRVSDPKLEYLHDAVTTAPTEPLPSPELGFGQGAEGGVMAARVHSLHLSTFLYDVTYRSLSQALSKFEVLCRSGS